MLVLFHKQWFQFCSACSADLLHSLISSSLFPPHSLTFFLLLSASLFSSVCVKRSLISPLWTPLRIKSSWIQFVHSPARISPHHVLVLCDVRFKSSRRVVVRRLVTLQVWSPDQSLFTSLPAVRKEGQETTWPRKERQGTRHRIGHEVYEKSDALAFLSGCRGGVSDATSLFNLLYKGPELEICWPWQRLR